MKITTKIILILVLYTLSVSCTTNQKKTEKGAIENDTLSVDTDTKEVLKSPTIKLLWQTDTLLTTCESVNYYKKEDVFLVSNIEGKPLDKDGVGSISKIARDGKIITRDFITGLNAPKGMGIFEDKLYVTDIDQLKVFDLLSGKDLYTFTVIGAVFLNDIAINSKGLVYFTDMKTGIIHQLKDNKITTLMELPKAGVNGLFVYDNDTKLLLATNGIHEFIEINLQDLSKRTIANDIGAGDGVAMTEKGNFIVSSWKGEIFHINKEGFKTSLLNTGEKYQTADIWYDANDQMILVPTFFGNRVECYKLNE